MNYKLALKLKDAGFPQREDCICSNFEMVDGEQVFFPTLSELLEKCLYEHVRLEKLPIGWQAVVAHHVKDDTYLADYVGHGKTPEEAVAKLWLKIH